MEWMEVEGLIYARIYVVDLPLVRFEEAGLDTASVTPPFGLRGYHRGYGGGGLAAAVPDRDALENQ